MALSPCVIQNVLHAFRLPFIIRKYECEVFIIMPRICRERVRFGPSGLNDYVLSVSVSVCVCRFGATTSIIYAAHRKLTGLLRDVYFPL